jgi:hypothetical protein
MLFLSIDSDRVTNTFSSNCYALPQYVQGHPTTVFRNVDPSNDFHARRVTVLTQFVNDALLLNQKDHLTHVHPQTLIFSLADSRDSLSQYFAWGSHSNSNYLIPDPLYISSYGYQSDRAKRVPWHLRKSEVFWRGSLSRPLNYWSACCESFPRYQLALQLAHVSSCDVKLCSADYAILPGPSYLDSVNDKYYHILSRFPQDIRCIIRSTLSSRFGFSNPLYRVLTSLKFRESRRHTQRFLRSLRVSGLLSNPVPMSEWGSYQFTIDIDGYGPSWKFFHCLAMGLVVFKVDSDYQQFFYPYLKPLIHYIPVCSDLSDLQAKIEWALSNPSATERISTTAADLADRLNYEWALRYFLLCLP